MELLARQGACNGGGVFHSGNLPWDFQPWSSGHLHLSLDPAPKSCINSVHLHTSTEHSDVRHEELRKGQVRAMKEDELWRLCSVSQNIHIPGSPLLHLGGPCALAECLWTRDSGQCQSKEAAALTWGQSLSQRILSPQGPSRALSSIHLPHTVPHSPLPFCTVSPPNLTALWLV